MTNVFSRLCITLACVMLSNGYSHDASIAFGTCTGNLPSIGHTVLGDLNNPFSLVGPFCSVSEADDVVALVVDDDKLSDDVDAVG
jgi:hypothetical protein